MKNVYIALCLVMSFHVQGQQNLTLFLRHEIPQANYVNPAVQISCKWFIGIPALTSVHTNYSNTAFTFHQLLQKNGDHHDLQMDKVYNQLHQHDLISAETYLHLFSIGYKHKDYYFSFHVTDKIRSAMIYPKELAGLAWQGNTQFVGEKARFNGLRTNSSYYREYAMGVSKQMNDYLTLGGHVKLLFGKAALYTSKSRGSLFTDENTFDLELASLYLLNASFPVDIQQGANGDVRGVSMKNDINYVKFLLNGKNKGVAIDAGVIYRYDERTTLSASILDLGIIRWKSDAHNFSQDGAFIYQGTGLNGNFNDLDYIRELADSVTDELGFSHTANTFITWLPMHIYLGVSYQLKHWLYAGVVNRNEIFRNKLHSSLTLSANAGFLERWAVSVSHTTMNSSLKNVGVGLGYVGRGFQFHVFSDNVWGMIKPLDTRNLNLRVGCNLLLGCPGKGDKSRVEKGFSPSELKVCPWIESSENKMKRRRKRLKK